MSKATITVFAGDGIGPEVTAEAQAVLEQVAPKHDLQLTFTSGVIGGAAIDATGVPLPAPELERAKSADAVLLGAVGGPKWDDPKASVRPEHDEGRGGAGVLTRQISSHTRGRAPDHGPIHAHRTRADDGAQPRGSELEGPVHHLDQQRMPSGVGDELLELSTRALVRIGCDVSAFAGAEDALAFLDRGFEIDAVVTDLTMPKMSGLELTREIRRRRPTVPVVLMTGYEMADGAALQREGIAAVLPKPFTVSEAAETLDRVLQKGGPAAAS